jgi:membrane fusion protein, multidrug efflux system
LMLCTVATLCILICSGGCRRDETQAYSLPAQTPVIVRPVNQISTAEAVFVSGALEADKTAPLSFLVAGKVDHVYIDEGDHVKKGQLLALVEPDDFVSNLQIAEADLMRTRDAYDRFQPLYEEGAFAEKNFIELKAALAQAAAGRDIAAKKLKDTKLRTPITGIVGAKFIEVGQMITPRVQAFTIVKTDTIFARLSVPESEIGKIALGQRTEIKVPALGDRTVEGEVTLIGAMADPQTRTFAVKIELANPDYILRTGMIVQANIVTDQKIEMLTIPGTAIVRDADNLTYVFTTDTRGGRALRRRVTPGSIFRNEIEIKKGLAPGDVVVVAGQHKISDGAAITIVGAAE